MCFVTGFDLPKYWRGKWSMPGISQSYMLIYICVNQNTFSHYKSLIPSVYSLNLMSCSCSKTVYLVIYSLKHLLQASFPEEERKEEIPSVSVLLPKLAFNLLDIWKEKRSLTVNRCVGYLWECSTLVWLSFSRHSRVIKGLLFWQTWTKTKKELSATCMMHAVYNGLLYWDSSQWSPKSHPSSHYLIVFISVWWTKTRPKIPVSNRERKMCWCHLTQSKYVNSL